jgi:acyl-CoA thioester hydrolase
LDREPLAYVVSDRPFVLRQTVKWSDCDPAGVVYTGNFVEYMTTAFRAFLGSLLAPSVEDFVRAENVDFPAKAISFVFDASLRPDEKFDVRVAVAAIKNTTFESVFTGTKAGGAACFTARMTTICVSPADRRAIRVPDALRRTLEPFLLAPAG